jgi:ATP-dependent helicase/nuclease subunit A
MTAAAYAIDGTPVSREAFYAAACDPKRPVVVEACAGAGKTWMLVSRILRALLDGAEPHEILAITFTKKAAGEMRERLDEWLGTFGSPACSHAQRVTELRARGMSAAKADEAAPRLAALQERVLRSGRLVEVRTFHAWFAQLLRAAPLELLAELGLQPDMALVEKPDELRPDVYRRFHAAVAAEPSLRADFDTLVRRRGRASLRRWLDNAWEKRVDIELADAAGTLDASIPRPVEGLAHPADALQGLAWQETLRELAGRLARGGANAQKAADKLAVALAAADGAAIYEGAWSALFTADKGEPRKLGVIDGLPATQGALQELCAQVRQHEAREEHLRMVRLVRTLLAEYAACKRTRALADMQDLERCALALLRDSTLAAWVQERLDARIRHLLIDEFQDTSPLQWHALHAWLAGYAGAGGGASGQQPPGIFIVGDPKQSIYRFRGAEPRVFGAAREFVVEAFGGQVLACDHTRRNAPALLAALNGVFEEAGRAGEFAGFRAHTTEVEASAPGTGVAVLPRIARPPKADKAAAPAAGWRDSLTVPRHEPDEVLREREAQAVAAAVQAVVAGGVPAGDVQVLCRKRESLRLVADALAALHVPFAAAEEFSLMESPEVRDLVALLDVLVSPQHALSLAHALRSPVFGASDADLAALARASSGHRDWTRALRELDDPGPALRRARECLARWRSAARQLPPHDLLDLVIGEGEVRERIAAAVPPERRAAALAAVDTLVQQALTLDGARYATPYNFVRALKRRDIKVPAALQPAAVQLLTVHGAKGLEASVVFVVDSDPEPKGAESATLLVDWPVEATHPRCCAFVYTPSKMPSALKPVHERECAAREREELNGLYVAMTRARSRLVFSATEPSRTGEGRSWWDRIQPWVGVQAPAMAAAAPPAAHAAAATLAVLPPLERRRVAGPRPAAERDDASRLGQAVHRVLEWGATERHGHAASLAPLAAAAALEFQVDAAEVTRLAHVIWRSDACARFFRGAGLRWAGNEVPVGAEGEALRIDRLVQLDDAWWVLDYKLQHAPQDLPAYREQLLRYRDAVRSLQPHDAVRCAFITGRGEVVEVEGLC